MSLWKLMSNGVLLWDVRLGTMSVYVSLWVWQRVLALVNWRRETRMIVAPLTTINGHLACIKSYVHLSRVFKKYFNQVYI